LRILVVFLVDFLSSESSDKDRGSVPDDLKNLSGRDFGDIDFEIGIPVVPGPAVEPADDCDCVETAKVGHGGIVDCTEHVDLGASDIGFVLIVDPVFVKPVIDGSLEIDVVSEVAGSG
jgi:hypothetical protein